MRVDLSIALNEGMTNLMRWHDRYSTQEYPEKVLLNLFYRKYAIESLWDELNGSFRTKLFGGKKVLWKDYNKAYNNFRWQHQDVGRAKILPILENRLQQNPERMVGSISYGDYSHRISKAKVGSASDLEEIEYAYLYYYLADECVMLWASIGGTGKGKIEAIGLLSSAIIETPEINTYAHAESVIGRLCVAPYMHNNYKALPPLS